MLPSCHLTEAVLTENHWYSLVIVAGSHLVSLTYPAPFRYASNHELPTQGQNLTSPLQIYTFLSFGRITYKINSCCPFMHYRTCPCNRHTARGGLIDLVSQLCFTTFVLVFFWIPVHSNLTPCPGAVDEELYKAPLFSFAKHHPRLFIPYTHTRFFEPLRIRESQYSYTEILHTHTDVYPYHIQISKANRTIEHVSCTSGLSVSATNSAIRRNLPHLRQNLNLSLNPSLSQTHFFRTNHFRQLLSRISCWTRAISLRCT